MNRIRKKDAPVLGEPLPLPYRVAEAAPTERRSRERERETEVGTAAPVRVPSRQSGGADVGSAGAEDLDALKPLLRRIVVGKLRKAGRESGTEHDVGGGGGGVVKVEATGGASSANLSASAGSGGIGGGGGGGARAWSASDRRWKGGSLQQLQRSGSGTKRSASGAGSRVDDHQWKDLDMGLDPTVLRIRQKLMKVEQYASQGHNDVDHTLAFIETELDILLRSVGGRQDSQQEQQPSNRSASWDHQGGIEEDGHGTGPGDRDDSVVELEGAGPWTPPSVLDELDRIRREQESRRQDVASVGSERLVGSKIVETMTRAHATTAVRRTVGGAVRAASLRPWLWAVLALVLAFMASSVYVSGLTYQYCYYYC